jgi:hypothetical protein
MLESKLIDDGDEQESRCHNCKCNDGVVKCEKIQCPKLDCSPEMQLSIVNECCSYCKGRAYIRGLNE